MAVHFRKQGYMQNRVAACGILHGTIAYAPQYVTCEKCKETEDFKQAAMEEVNELFLQMVDTTHTQTSRHMMKESS